MADSLELLRLRAKAKAKARAASVNIMPEYEPSGGLLEGTDLMNTMKDQGGKLLKAAGAIAGYPGGLARVAARGLQDIPYAIRTGLQGDIQSVGREGDLSRALSGQAPTSEEYMARQGVEPGVGRTVEGIVTDIALDPLTYMTLGSSGVAKAISNPQLRSQLAKQAQYMRQQVGGELANKDLLSRLTEKLGRKSYKSGLKELDLEAKTFNKTAVPSDVLEKHGFSGSAVEGQKAIDRIAEELIAQRDFILKQVDEAGGKISLAEAMQPLQKKLDELRALNHPEQIGLIKKMQGEVDRMLTRENPAYSKVSFAPKTETIGELPVSAEYKPAYSEVQGYTPKVEEIIELPVQAEYMGPYRELPKSKGGLPIGTQEPVSTQIAKDLREFRQTKEMPDAILKGEAPFNADEAVQMGQLKPERYIQQPPVAGYYEEAGRSIPGKTMPEQYVPQKPTLYFDVEPAKAIAGKTIPENKLTATQGTRYKTIEQKRLPRTAWQPTHMSRAEQDLIKAKAAGLRQEVESTIGRTLGKDTEQQFKLLNEEAGSLLTSKKKAEALAKRETNKNLLTSVDPINTTLGYAAGGSLGAVASTVAKKIADLLKTQQARTGAGKFLMDRAKTEQLLEKSLFYQPAVGAERQIRQTPWLDMEDKNKLSGETN